MDKTMILMENTMVLIHVFSFIFFFYSMRPGSAGIKKHFQ
jgi:hypothetical protein